MEPDEGSSVIVIDNGSHSIKAGFSGDDAPKAVFRTFIGTRLEMIDVFLKTFYTNGIMYWAIDSSHLSNARSIAEGLRHYGQVLIMFLPYELFLKFTNLLNLAQIPGLQESVLLVTMQTG